VKKKFENWFMFVKVMGKSLVSSFFLTHSVFMFSGLQSSKKLSEFV